MFQFIGKGLVALISALLMLIPQVRTMEAYVRENIWKDNEDEEYPPGFDMRLKGAASPELRGAITCLGDIVAPLDLKWEADS